MASTRCPRNQLLYPQTRYGGALLRDVRSLLETTDSATNAHRVKLYWRPDARV